MMVNECSDVDVAAPDKVLQTTVHKDVAKTGLSRVSMLLLGFLGGAFIALGYLAYIRVVSAIPHEWEGLAVLLGAAVFPIGLICILFSALTSILNRRPNDSGFCTNSFSRSPIVPPI